jgi:hypothetical protein
LFVARNLNFANPGFSRSAFIVAVISSVRNPFTVVLLIVSIFLDFIGFEDKLKT